MRVPAVFVAGASAATVTLTSAVSTSFDEGERVLGQDVDVAVEAANGEQNAITLATTAGDVRVADAGAPLTAGKGCVQDGPSAVRCAVVRPPMATPATTTSSRSAPAAAPATTRSSRGPPAATPATTR